MCGKYLIERLCMFGKRRIDEGRKKTSSGESGLGLSGTCTGCCYDTALIRNKKESSSKSASLAQLVKTSCTEGCGC